MATYVAPAIPHDAPRSVVGYVMSNSLNRMSSSSGVKYSPAAFTFANRAAGTPASSALMSEVVGSVMKTSTRFSQSPK